MDSKQEDKKENKDDTGKETAEGRPAYIFNQFVEETSIHGVKNAFDTSKSKKHRLIWIVLGLVAIGTLLKLIHELFDSYSQYPVRTLVTVHPTDRLPFPAVTLCNLNGVEMSKLRALDTDTFNVSTSFGEMALFTTELRKLKGIRESNLTLPQVVETELLNKTFQGISRRTFADLNTTLVQCTWDNKNIDCADLFTEVDMEDRRCFQFNVATTAMAGRRESTKSGLSSGLKVMVNLRQYEYTFNDLRSFSAGAQVILHEPDEVPDLQRGFIVSPGFTHFANMLMKKRCRSTQYDVTLSSAYFPSITAQKILHKIKFLNKSIVRQNVFVLKLYYDEMMYYQISHQPVHTMESILGRLGGQMGLFIGASVLSLAELLNLLMNLCRRAARAVCCAPKVTSCRQTNLGKL